MRRGSFCEAGRALSQAMVCLENNNLHHSRTACHIIELSALLKWSAGDLASCEQFLKEHLRVAQIIGDEIKIIHAVSPIWAFYKDYGRLDMAAYLSESFPEILGESGDCSVGRKDPNFAFS